MRDPTFDLRYRKSEAELEVMGGLGEDREPCDGGRSGAALNPTCPRCRRSGSPVPAAR